ncbi:hypothetical protein ACTJMU_05235 [Mixta calida]|uniref:hypothetical protein n=2 Tax=Mixta calida TaxID=665913 RepID=UPI00403AC352
MKKNKPSNHHWWPKSLSQFWKNENGLIYMFSPDGEIKAVPPAQVALIRNGHNIKLSDLKGEETAFDCSFESVFDNSDINFPMVVTELLKLILKHEEGFRKLNISERFSDEFFCLVVECAISLAVRSPRYREKIKSIVELYRGTLSNNESKKYIALNMKGKHESIVQRIAKSAAICVLYDPKSRFIFGDGFYQNIPAIIPPLTTLKIVVPFTPAITVIVHSGKSRGYLGTNVININSSESELCNSAIEIYSNNVIFSKSLNLNIDDFFKVNKFMEFNFLDDPMSNLIGKFFSE